MSPSLAHTERGHFSLLVQASRTADHAGKPSHDGIDRSLIKKFISTVDPLNKAHDP